MGSDWDEFIGFEFEIYDLDEVVVHLLGLVFPGSNRCVCWIWFCKLRSACLLGLGLVFLVRCLCEE